MFFTICGLFSQCDLTIFPRQSNIVMDIFIQFSYQNKVSDAPLMIFLKPKTISIYQSDIFFNIWAPLFIF